jgi:hypothetical protein
MSFTKTISTVAALASIFGAAAAGWKLTEASSQQPPTELDQKLNQLDQKLEDLTKPAPVTLPETPPEAPVLTSNPDPATIPPVAPPPPPVPTETQP